MLQRSYSVHLVLPKIAG